jgi:hypothetical protein
MKQEAAAAAAQAPAHLAALTGELRLPLQELHLPSTMWRSQLAGKGVPRPRTPQPSALSRFIKQLLGLCWPSGLWPCC